MIEKYGLFNHHEDNNTALILFSDEPVTDKRGDEEIKVLYHIGKDDVCSIANPKTKWWHNAHPHFDARG